MTLIRQGLRAERASTEPAARLSVIAQIFRRRGEGRLLLRRVAEVAVVEATDLGQGDHAAVLRWLDRARLRCILLERGMRPRAVVVAQVALQTTSQMSLVQDDDVVEKLAADGADHPLGERVLPGGAWCRKNSAMHMPFTRRRNPPPSMLSRSRTRKRRAESSGKAPAIDGTG